MNYTSISSGLIALSTTTLSIVESGFYDHCFSNKPISISKALLLCNNFFVLNFEKFCNSIGKITIITLITSYMFPLLDPTFTIMCASIIDSYPFFKYTYMKINTKE